MRHPLAIKVTNFGWIRWSEQ